MILQNWYSSSAECSFGADQLMTAFRPFNLPCQRGLDSSQLTAHDPNKVSRWSEGSARDKLSELRDDGSVFQLFCLAVRTCKCAAYGYSR